jgi:hypothetical protein
MQFENTTFGDFIRESELYEYSKEYFDLTKELGEIKLVERYLENQHFLLENSEIIQKGTFTESYFTESVDEKALQLLEEKFSEKIGKLGNTIKTCFKKLFGMVIIFFKKFCTRLTSDKAQAEEILKNIKLLSTPIQVEVQNEIVTFIKDTQNELNGYIFEGLDDKQYAGAELIKIVIPTSAGPTIKQAVRAVVANCVRVRANSGGAVPLSLSQIEEIYSLLVNNVRVTETSLSTIEKSVRNSIHNAMRKGIVISFFDEKDLSETIAKLEGFEKKINQLESDNTSERNKEIDRDAKQQAAGGSEAGNSLNVSAYDSLNAKLLPIYKELVKSVGATIKAYTNAIVYRKKVGKKIIDAIKIETKKAL